jgi:hypothetical protein
MLNIKDDLDDIANVIIAEKYENKKGLPKHTFVLNSRSEKKALQE